MYCVFKLMCVHFTGLLIVLRALAVRLFQTTDAGVLALAVRLPQTTGARVFD